jgi:hypothetical protein
MGMLSIAALYAAAVYLALAWRTRFPPYAYIGWTFFLVGALAIVQWATAAQEWSFFVLAVVSLVLLVPHRLRRYEAAAAVDAPALHLGALTSLAAALTTAVLGLTVWTTLAVPRLPGGGYSTAALAFAAVALVALAVGWSRTLRDLERRPPAALLDGTVLALYGLVTVAIGVGTRSRMLVLVGAGFVGFAAIRGAVLAVSEGVPIAVILAAFAVLLLGGALWLSLRARRVAGSGRVQSAALGDETPGDPAGE